MNASVEFQPARIALVDSNQPTTQPLPTQQQHRGCWCWGRPGKSVAEHRLHQLRPPLFVLLRIQ